MISRRIYLACQLTQGSFSGEIIFEVETLDKGRYVGVAPRRDCVHANGDKIDANELEGQEIDGKIATLLIGNGGDIARVALPDGESIKVPVSLISEREPEIASVSV
jgi:hypothetical protein